MSNEHSTLLLASASPRRRELLGSLGIPFDVLATEADETIPDGEAIREAVVRLAVAKAEIGVRRQPEAVVLGADTLVVMDERPFGKPWDPAEARRMLGELSGRTHFVWTGVALARRGLPTLRRAVVAEVDFRGLSAREIDAYVETGEPLDKAGSYAIQGRAAAFVTELRGELSTVIGLPMRVTIELLRQRGVLSP